MPPSKYQGSFEDEKKKNVMFRFGMSTLGFVYARYCPIKVQYGPWLVQTFFVYRVLKIEL